MKTRSKTILLALSLAVIGLSSRGEGEGKLLRLQSYDENTVGLTWDDNDVSFLDFKLSQQVPLFNDGQFSKGANRLMFGFTGRFAQYVATRDSAPVVGKRFNPFLFGRHWLGNEDTYLEIAYGHESNGQGISTEAAYLRLRESLSLEGQDPDFANDNISRGWDYLGGRFARKYKLFNPSPSKSGVWLWAKIDFRYWLSHGVLQQGAEEYYDWENRTDGKSRKQVDGVRISLSCEYELPGVPVIDGLELSLRYRTGYDNLFDHHTAEIELGPRIKGIPIVIWASTGYNSDIADYYKKVDSFGVKMNFRTL